MQPARKVTLVATALIVGGLALLANASAVTNRAVPCRPGKAKLIAADTQAVVYLGRVAEPSHIRVPVYLGCLRSGRRAYEVGGPGVGSSSVVAGTRHMVLAGQIVAWEQWSSIGMGEPKEKEWRVFVRDLRSGRVLQKLATGATTVPEWTGVGPTTQIVVSASGAVAWIARVEDEQGHQHGYEVHAADKAGARLLASGTSIEPDSLALAGRTLYWTQEGKPSAAALN